MPKNDLTNKKYGYLTVLYFYGVVNKKTYWVCECKCGNKLKIRADNIVSGKAKSCGCYKTECDIARHKTHGLSDELILKNHAISIMGVVVLEFVMNGLIMRKFL
jgi:hypothetical protein